MSNETHRALWGQGSALHDRSSLAGDSFHLKSFSVRLKRRRSKLLRLELRKLHITGVMTIRATMSLRVFRLG